jgi:hypothetical protein
MNRHKKIEVETLSDTFKMSDKSTLSLTPELIPGPDGQYFTTANLWTWDQMRLAKATG